MKEMFINQYVFESNRVRNAQFFTAVNIIYLLEKMAHLLNKATLLRAHALMQSHECWWKTKHVKHLRQVGNKVYTVSKCYRGHK